MNKSQVFVVDDDQSTRSYLLTLLTERGHQVECFADGGELLARWAAGSTPHLVLLDVVMPDCDGVELFGKMRTEGWNVPVIMLSGTHHLRAVVQAMQLGAVDFLLKPVEEDALYLAIHQALNQSNPKLPGPLPPSGTDGGDFMTRNPKMLRLREIIEKVARTDVPILILGESGVGKEVMARHAHRHSGRTNKPFIKVNCAALPTDLLESELFGYERGAFTGAHNDKPGKFELANGGTLLLDEIGDMSPLLQSKLLHVLQDGTFSRLGSKKNLRVDVRIIATTNIQLEEAIAKGTFREDLYYRLNVIRIQIPPLRERREDIPDLCCQLTARYGEKYGNQLRRLPERLLETLIRYAWPGNVRELENVIKRLMVLNDAAAIIRELSGTDETLPAPSNETPKDVSVLAVGAMAADRAERELVESTLAQNGGNRKKAAASLDISYKALRNKIKRWKNEHQEQARRAVA